jgi:hypothetical protein
VIDRGRGAVLDKKLLEEGQRREFKLPAGRRMLYRTRYFTDSGIIGSREYVRRFYRAVQDRFAAKRDKISKPIVGLDGIYCPSTNGIFWPRAAFSLVFNPRPSALRLRLKTRSGLALNQNPPFVEGHYLFTDAVDGVNRHEVGSAEHGAWSVAPNPLQPILTLKEKKFILSSTCLKILVIPI